MNNLTFVAFAAIAAAIAAPAAAQAPASVQAPDRAAILNAARSVIEQARYCALITVDESGQPHARTVDAFPPEDGFVVWMATNPATRKVEHIKRNPRVTLYYFDPKDPGYVTLMGEAALVDAPGEKAKRWKEDWVAFYKDRNKGSDYVLIRVIPSRVEVVSYTHKVLNDPKTWAVPAVRLP